jgi:phosphatidate cytidylyltransferase
VIVRLAAGFIGLAVVVPSIVFGGELAVQIIVPIAMALGIYEYARMAFPDSWKFSAGWLAMLTFVPYGAILYVGWDRAGSAAGMLFIATCVAVVLRPGASLDQAFSRIGRYVVGAGLIGLLVFLPLLRGLEHGLAWVFLALGIAWLSDTGAYFAGRSLGRNKLHPQISPNKTVEGYVGGLVTCILGVAVIKYLGLPELSWLDVPVIGLGAGTLGVLGDLTESLIKRATGVKDSGSIMPGHGGILDRVDSLIFVVPVLYGYAMYVKGLV